MVIIRRAFYPLTAIVAFAVTRPGEAGQLDGGLNLPSALKCIWEALVCVGMSHLLTGIAATAAFAVSALLLQRIPHLRRVL